MTGQSLEGWTPRPRPERRTIAGRHAKLRPIDVSRDAPGLYRLSHGPEADALWAYLPRGPFTDEASFTDYVAANAQSADPFFYAVTGARDDDAVGWLALMRIDSPNGVIEVGNILYTPALQRSIAATEAQFLAMAYIFDELGYRRYEWKCNNRNEPSKRAARRFGFSFEGLFRQHMIVKGENRDTAWFAMIDAEWPGLKQAYETWLEPGNFDAVGRQRISLATLTAEALGREEGIGT